MIRIDLPAASRVQHIYHELGAYWVLLTADAVDIRGRRSQRHVLCRLENDALVRGFTIVDRYPRPATHAGEPVMVGPEEVWAWPSGRQIVRFPDRQAEDWNAYRAARSSWWKEQWLDRQHVVSTDAHVVAVGNPGTAARLILLGPQPGRAPLKSGEIFVYSRAGGDHRVYRFGKTKGAVTEIACDRRGSALVVQAVGQELIRFDLD